MPSRLFVAHIIPSNGVLVGQSALMSATKKDDKLLYCSFCGKNQYEIKLLISGSAAYIGGGT